MTEKCTVCGGERSPFDEVAEAAFDTVIEFGEDTIKHHCPDGNIPDFLGESLLSGLLQGATALAFSMASDNIDAIKAWLQAELETAIAIEEQADTEEEGGMVQ